MNQPGEERADLADGPEGQAENESQDHSERMLAAAIFVGSRHGEAEQKAGGERDRLDPGQHAEELDVQPHVAVLNVAEFVSDDPLQLLSLEAFHSALRDADDRVLSIK